MIKTTLKQVKDEVARQKSYKDWDDVLRRIGTIASHWYMDDVAKLYAAYQVVESGQPKRQNKKIKVSSHQTDLQSANSGQLQQHVVMESVCECQYEYNDDHHALLVWQCPKCEAEDEQTAP